MPAIAPLTVVAPAHPGAPPLRTGPLGPRHRRAAGALAHDLREPTRRGEHRLAIEASGRLIAVTVLTRTATPLIIDTVPTTSDAQGDVPAPDPIAWPRVTAEQTARARWRRRRPGVIRLQRLALADPSDGRMAAEVIGAVAGHAAGMGFARLDVRVGSPAVADLFDAAGWFGARVDGNEVRSVLSACPWHPLRTVTPGLLPPRAARMARRVARLRPSTVLDLALTAAEEAAGCIRDRRRPQVGQPTHTPGDPDDDTAPFSTSRYRTVRRALAMVAPTLRTGTFLDVGCGDGRVLDQATRAGFAETVGWDLDADLVERANAGLRPDRARRCDATTEPIEAAVTVIYLFNPFGPASVERFAANVAASLAAAPRPLLVLYANAQTIDPFLDAGLTLVHADPHLAVLATTA